MFEHSSVHIDEQVGQILAFSRIKLKSYIETTKNADS